jgi:hypothetical protein
MKGVLPWLIRWACRASTRDFCPALAVLTATAIPFLYPFMGIARPQSQFSHSYVMCGNIYTAYRHMNMEIGIVAGLVPARK